MLIPEIKILIEKYWGCCGQKWLWPPWSRGEWMNELSWFFACSYMLSGKLKVILGMPVVKYSCDLLRPGTLKSALSQEQTNELSWFFTCWRWCNNFWLGHYSWSVSFTFKYWGSTVVVFVTYLLLVCHRVCLMVNIAQSYLIFYFSINCMFPLVFLGFPRLILVYFLVSCCY